MMIHFFPLSTKSIIISLILLLNSSANACSMFKLTKGQNNIIGCNHDAWVTEPQLKFTSKGYRSAFTGATRYQGKIAPQSGMNEHGLVFTTLSIYPPKNQKKFKGIPIKDRTQFLESVLQSCKTLEEVEQFFSRYNRSCFLQDLFVYIDSAGRVLFVEPFSMHYSNNSTLIQSNFCPSETSDLSKIQQERFIRGNSFIAKGFRADFDFGRKLIEEMSVSRKRHGDGTLISTIWDNQNLRFDVIFYHEFSVVKSFDLKLELLKGDTTYLLEELFPRNKDFEDLKAYKTPFNTPILRLLLAFVGCLSGILGFWFLIKAARNSALKSRLFWPLQALASILGLGYCYILATDISMFYYDWPYVHPNSNWRTFLSFTPFALVLVFLRNIILFKKFIIDQAFALILETGLFAIIIAGFLYWSF